jgi:glycosyltransferase involved in cell wall biosynthesis
MRFTIYTGFYEYLDTFDQLVESVNSQTYKNWEWIVSDDFSSNLEVSKKLEELASNNPKVKIAKPSYKKEFYWNPPIDMSTGDIFMVLDSDDIMFPKLLEVYKHNFEKFPEVQLISTNSIIYNDNINGSLRATRHINYKNNCNIYQSTLDNSYEYNYGDCRAWRNNIKKFSEKDEWIHCAEDVLKITTCEEKGKVLFLPRTLHGYSYRENSISHTSEKGDKINEETNRMFELSNSRVDRKCLNSIEDYYDRCFEQTSAFYLSPFNKEKDCCLVNYFSPSISPREIEVIKNLYFDHNIVFNSDKSSDYLIVKIISKEDIDILESKWFSIFPKKHITIQTEKNLVDDVNQFMNKVNFGGYYYFQYFHFNILKQL